MKSNLSSKYISKNILKSKALVASAVSILASCFMFTSIAQGAEVVGPPDSHIGFSGVEYHIPRQSRSTWYKYQATRNKMRADGTASAQNIQNSLNGQDAQSLRRNYSVSDGYIGDCAISIGNVSKSPLSGRSDNVVIIDGDVINAGDCN